MLVPINVAGGVWVNDGADNVDMVVVGGTKVAKKGGRWRGAGASAVVHGQGREARVSDKWLPDCIATWECLPFTAYLVWYIVQCCMSFLSAWMGGRVWVGLLSRRRTRFVPLYGAAAAHRLERIRREGAYKAYSVFETERIPPPSPQTGQPNQPWNPVTSGAILSPLCHATGATHEERTGGATLWLGGMAASGSAQRRVAGSSTGHQSTAHNKQRVARVGE